MARADRTRAKQACDVFSFVYDNFKQNKKDLISIITIKTKSFAFVYYLFVLIKLANYSPCEIKLIRFKNVSGPQRTGKKFGILVTGVGILG